MTEADRQRGLSRTARQALVRQLLETHEVSSQGELTELLAAQGVHVTQGTVSKDLVDVGAVRTRSSSGVVSYVISADEPAAQAVTAARLARLCVEVLIDAEASANLVIARTPPGAAQYFASALDRVGWDDVLGTIAGDDTVLLISRDPNGGDHVASRLRELSTGRQLDHLDSKEDH